MTSQALTPPAPPASPRRIAFCITELDPGGAEKALVQLVTRLNRQQWEPRVYCLGPEAPLASVLRQAGIPVFCYGATSSRSLGVFRWLTRELKAFRPVIIQSFLFHSNIVGRIAGWRAGIPIIVSGHRVAERQKNWHLWLDQFTKRLVTQHVCVSRGVADHIARRIGVSPQDVTVIPNGVDVDLNQPISGSIREELGLPSTAALILAAGRLHPQKGFINLIDAFHLISPKSPNTHLLILGEGEQRGDLEAAIHRLGLHERVHLLGYRIDLLDIMRQVNLFTLTSKWEGMPNVVLEAMACGVPVLAMEVEGVRDLIISRQSGIVVKQGDIEGFANAAHEILTNPSLSRQLSNSAQQIVKTDFTWDRMTRQYEQFYLRLID